MGNFPTKFNTQEVLNYSTDDTVAPPLLQIGMMAWNGSAWTRWNPTTTFDSRYIKLDGTSVTTAAIPFALGLSATEKIETDFTVSRLILTGLDFRVVNTRATNSLTAGVYGSAVGAGASSTSALIYGGSFVASTDGGVLDGPVSVYGVYATAVSANAGHNHYGVYGAAANGTLLNYGVFSQGNSATSNYANTSKLLITSVDASGYATLSATGALLYVQSIEPILDEETHLIGASGNRWNNVFTTSLDVSGTMTVGSGATQGADFDWNTGVYNFNIHLSAIGGTFTLENVAGFKLGFASSVASSDKVATFQNVTGTVYVSGGTDVTVADGGTGRSSHTAYALIAGGTTTTAAQQSIANSASSNFPLVSKGTSVVPGWGSVTYPTSATTGQLAAATALNALGFLADITYSEPVLTIGSGKAATDYGLTFNGETNDGVLTWMEDEDYFKFSDDIMLPDNEAIKLGTGGVGGPDASITFNGSGLIILSNAITSTDYLQLQGGTNGIDFVIGSTEQISLIDGVLKPTTTNDVDLGTTLLLFKDLYLSNSIVLTGTTNGAVIDNDGSYTMYGTSKKKLSMRPYIEQGSVAGAGKPTIVTRGVTKGYSMPLYAADEEIFISEYIAGRWDGATDITISVIGYLDTAETDGDDFALQLSWVNKSTASGILPATSTDVVVETNLPAPRNAQYSIFKVDFTIDWDIVDPDILASDYFSARIRRIAVAGGGAVEMAGEFVITSIIISYTVDKMFKAS